MSTYDLGITPAYQAGSIDEAMVTSITLEDAEVTLTAEPLLEIDLATDPVSGFFSGSGALQTYALVAGEGTAVTAFTDALTDAGNTFLVEFVENTYLRTALANAFANDGTTGVTDATIASAVCTDGGGGTRVHADLPGVDFAGATSGLMAGVLGAITGAVNDTVLTDLADQLNSASANLVSGDVLRFNFYLRPNQIDIALDPSGDLDGDIDPDAGDNVYTSDQIQFFSNTIGTKTPSALALNEASETGGLSVWWYPGLTTTRAGRKDGGDPPGVMLRMNINIIDSS